MRDKTNVGGSNYNNRIEVLIAALLLTSIVFSNSGFLLSRGILYFVFIGTIIFTPVIRQKLYMNHWRIIGPAILLICYNIILILYKYESIESIYNGVIYSSSLLFFVILISGKYNYHSLNSFTKYVSAISKILITLNLLLLIFDIPLRWVSSTSFIFLFLYFIYLDDGTSKKSKLIFTLFWIITVVFNEARTFMLLVPVFIFLNLFSNKITENFVRYKIYFYIFGIFLFIIPIIYILLSESDYASVLNSYALRYTGSRFFSSRDLLWSQLLNNYYEGDIIFGGGHHISPSFLFQDIRSSHNTYVSVLIRTGVLGSVLFLYFLKSIWIRYYELKDIPAIRLSAIFFIILLLKQSSELLLIGNNISVSIFSWLVMAYGLMYGNSIKSKKEVENDKK